MGFIKNRKYEALTTEMEELKEKFSEFENQDVRVREEMKHCKVKGKKLEKALEAEKTKVKQKIKLFQAKHNFHYKFHLCHFGKQHLRNIVVDFNPEPSIVVLDCV